jgi:hypothetical protein
MSATKLGLYELLAPQFLAGFTFPDYIDRYLAVLSIDELRSSIDETGIVYTGRVSFEGEGGAVPGLEHRHPTGAVFRSEDRFIDFRLTLPRDGTAAINTVVTTAAVGGAIDPELAQLDTLFNTFGVVEQAAEATDYPGVRFRLELLLSLVTFHLSKVWGPGEIGPDGRIVASTDPQFVGQDVRLVMPKVAFVYEQGDNFPFEPPTFQLRSWGNAGLDAPADIAMGELFRMEPPIARHESGRYGFGIDQVLVDFSSGHTPPEILEHFGTDEAFEGLYLKSLRFYYADKDKDFAVNFAINDALISFAGEVSLEGLAEVYGPETQMKVQVRLLIGDTEVIPVGGEAVLPNVGAVQVAVTGGTPPYLVDVHLLDPVTGAEVGTDLWDPDERVALLSPGMFNDPPLLGPAGLFDLRVRVTDSSPPPAVPPTPPAEAETPRTFEEKIRLTIVDSGPALNPPPKNGSLLDSPADPPDVVFNIISVTVDGAPEDELPEHYDISHRELPGNFVALTVSGKTTPSVTVGGAAQPLSQDGEVTVEVKPGATVTANVNFTARASAENNFHLFFDIDRPFNTLADVAEHIANAPDPGDVAFTNNSKPVEANTPSSGQGAAALRFWADQLDPAATVQIDAHASFESDDNVDTDKKLSERRREVALDVLGITLDEALHRAHGHAEADGQQGSHPENFRVARVKGVLVPLPAVQAVVELKREPPNLGEVPVKEETPKAPEPSAPDPNKAPPVFRKAGIRVRLERNKLVLLEIFGTLDFETDLEESLRSPSTDPDERLELEQRLGASTTPEDGVVDFKLNITYDTSTHFLTETLTLGAAPGDANGLLEMRNPKPPATEPSRLKNALGAVLALAPVINEAADALDPESAGDWAVLAVSLGVPIALGATNKIIARKVTLFGGELKSRQFNPPGETFEVTDASIVFDYGVEFDLDIPLPGGKKIATTAPVKVRYKAVGFNLHFPDGDHYQPIFDTSKGYDINIRDAGAFALPAPLGDLLNITAARIARFNPVTLELDMGLKADLGVITVDKFKLKWPLSPEVGVPTITPTGVKVDVSNVVVGSGYVKMLDNGFQGAIDITIVPIKVRVAGTLSVQKVTDAATSRTATAVFVGLVVQFPSPIVVAATGLGIYGMSGLFAMHYKRAELPPQPGDSVGPALRWLERAGGDPTRLVFNGDELWVPELDRWSFGVGVILGTMEGGFLMNFRGMFVLELPGPRILIFVKVQIIKELPALPDGQLTTGVLGVVDLDFNLGQLTIGVVVDLSVKDLISVKLPVEAFFKLNDPRNWHLDIGTTTSPASATVLGIYRARGYFMLHGDQIAPFPPDGVGLPGTAVATGIEAALTLGDEDVGLYLRVAARADMGIAFSPFFITGQIKLSGELHLFIVGIEARGTLDVEAPDPTFIRGEICGKVDFFFFSVEGCVGLSIGDSERNLPAPPLVRGVYLQSHAPVLTAGQGGDRPIDASLGDAVALTPAGGVPAGATIPVVPIDSVPVIQMHASPKLGSPVSTFTQPLVASPGLLPDGWIEVGAGRQVRYELKAVELSPGLPAGAAKPPATWRRDQPPGSQGVDTAVDLALFSRVPATAERAFERSTELQEMVTTRWENLCDPVAPPACVLWTFCGQPLGPSGDGWELTGIPQRDPPGTVRTAPPSTLLQVEEPPRQSLNSILDLIAADAAVKFNVPAKVIGEPVSAKALADKKTLSGLLCRRVLQLPDQEFRQIQDALRLSNDAQSLLDKRANSQFLTFNTGPATKIEFLVAVAAAMVDSQAVVFRELNEKGTVLKQSTLQQVSIATVTGTTTGLSAEWIDPNGPWAAEVVPVAEFLAQPQFAGLIRRVVSIKPTKGCVKIEIRIEEKNTNVHPPTVLVGVVRVCSLAEEQRAADGEEIRTGQIQTVTGFLNGGDPVPLLAPNTTYTLTVRYDAQSRTNGGPPTTDAGLKQQFRFRTDAEAPKRLDPWVLGTTPDHEDRYHFYEDAVKVVFNDVSVVQLFSAYGRDLRVRLRAADGVPAGEDTITDLAPVAGQVSTPLHDALTALANAGLLPCTGALTGTPPHGSYTSNVPLRPLMAYTFDIVVDPPDPEDPAAVPTPLFRRSFATSRYASAAALAAHLQGSSPQHRGLTAPVVGLPTGGKVVIATEEQIQLALTGAGEQALPAAETPGVTLYWAAPPGSSTFAPHAILIDAQEPLWRTRQEPKLETVPGQSDPAFQHIVPQTVPALEIVETGTSFVERFVCSPGGTRTLVILSSALQPPPDGVELTLSLRRPASALYGLAEETTRLVSLTLRASAPWEDDHE